MVLQLLTALLAIAPIASVSAHFHLNYPWWRGDSLALSSKNSSISQWNYPCAGIGQENSTNNRTAWPADGGSIIFAGSHPWALTYVNLGIGATVTNFNISLVEGFNQTGNGTFCWNKVPFDAAKYNVTVADGTPASIQVIQISHTGASLYNCADITFSSNATLLSDSQCKNATGVGGVGIENESSGSKSGNGSSSSSSGSASGSASPSTSSQASGAEGNARAATALLVGAVALGFAGLL
jgi:hypothetical protein